MTGRLAAKSFCVLPNSSLVLCSTRLVDSHHFLSYSELKVEATKTSMKVASRTKLNVLFSIAARLAGFSEKIRLKLSFKGESTAVCCVTRFFYVFCLLHSCKLLIIEVLVLKID